VSPTEAFTVLGVKVSPFSPTSTPWTPDAVEAGAEAELELELELEPEFEPPEPP